MSIYQHFRKDEHQFVDKILQVKNRVEETYEPFVSVFLTPRQISVASALFSKSDSVSLYQSNVSLERKRCVIAYDFPEKNDFKESILTIHFPSKFYQLKHSSILGAVLNCGVKREFIGDIVTDGEIWQIIVATSIVSFLKEELKSVGSAKVRLEESEYLLTPIDTAKKLDTLIASQRLDVLIATAFNVSRHVSKDLIEQGHVTLNWGICNKADAQIAEQDVVSVRGYGRILLYSINGMTQKGKFKITLYVHRNRK